MEQVMAHKFINEIEPGVQINDIYMVKEPILRSTTKGDLYIAMFIADRTGQLNGRMWQASEEIYNALPKPGFVHIQGRSELYQNNLQLVVNSISVVEPAKVQLDDFLARTDKDVTQMLAEIKDILNKIKNTQLKAIVNEFLNDGELMKKFCTAPAAMAMHHSCIGGLLEHTHNMLRIAAAILPLYEQVQPDLVLAGIFLHDIGKTEELTYDITFSYTDTGQLIGHIVQSMIMLHKKADALAEKGSFIDRTILDSLGHIILCITDNTSLARRNCLQRLKPLWSTT